MPTNFDWRFSKMEQWIISVARKVIIGSDARCAINGQSNGGVSYREVNILAEEC